MVESQPSKLVAWVRFPSPAPELLPVHTKEKGWFIRRELTDGKRLISFLQPGRNVPLQITAEYEICYGPVAQSDRATAF